MAAIQIRYQTNGNSDKEINFPKRPVPPARRIARCKRIYDSLKLIYGHLLAKLIVSNLLPKVIK